MRRWSEVAERVASTTRTSEKTRLLAEYLAGLDREVLGPAVVFFSGRAFPESDGRAMGLGWATLAESVTRVAGVSRAELGAAYDRYSDLGRAVGDVLGAHADDAGQADDPGPDEADPPTVPEVAASFAAIEAARGPAAKASEFESLLRRCDPLTATYVVKILGGELRIGLREGLVEAAIARAFDRPVADVAAGRDAHRRPRRDRRPGPRRPPGLGTPAPLPPAPLHARLAGRGRRRDRRAPRLGGLDGGQVRRDPGPAAPTGRRGPPLLARPARRVWPVPGGHRGGADRSTGTGSSTASCSRFATGRSFPSSPSRSASGGRRRRQGSWPRSPSRSSRSTSSLSAPAAATSSRCSRSRSTTGAPASRRSTSATRRRVGSP